MRYFKKNGDLWLDCNHLSPVPYRKHIDVAVTFSDMKQEVFSVDCFPKSRELIVENLSHKDLSPCVQVTDFKEWKAFMASHEYCAEQYYPSTMYSPTPGSYYYEPGAMECYKKSKALHDVLWNKNRSCLSNYCREGEKIEEAALKLSEGGVNADSAQGFYIEFLAQLGSFEVFWVLGGLYGVQILLIFLLSSCKNFLIKS
jgi:hypothetical protein